MGVTAFDTLATATVNGITATAGGGQANAYPLSAVVSKQGPGSPLLSGGGITADGQAGAFRIDTVATAGDSVALPPSNNSSFRVPIGTEIWITNAGANAMQVFGTANDTVNGAAAGTGVSHPAGASAIYKLMGVNLATGAGDWRRNLSA